jgi:ABC-type transporter Mla MlaB component
MAANVSVVEPPVLKIEKISLRNQILVRLAGKITKASCTDLLGAISKLKDSTKPIVLDLQDVSSIDRAGIHGLVDLWASAKESNRCLQMAHTNILKGMFCDAPADEGDGRYRPTMKDFSWF